MGYSSWCEEVAPRFGRRRDPYKAVYPPQICGYANIMGCPSLNRPSPTTLLEPMLYILFTLDKGSTDSLLHFMSRKVLRHRRIVSVIPARTDRW